LAIDKHSEKIPIAAKKVNLQEFCCQDLRYIDNNYQNIVKICGTRRNDKDDQYYILMENWIAILRSISYRIKTTF
jgi:hypothetical protein